jgi:hypothetical protein
LSKINCLPWAPWLKSFINADVAPEGFRILINKNKALKLFVKVDAEDPSQNIFFIKKHR